MTNSRGRRPEEHLVKANLVLRRADAVRIPVWIISLDLSRAFDRVPWPTFRAALVDQGIAVHDVWMFALATPGAKATRTSKTMLRDQIEDVLSLLRIGSLGGGSTKL